MVSNSSLQKYGDSLLLDSTSVTLESSDDRVHEEQLDSSSVTLESLDDRAHEELDTLVSLSLDCGVTRVELLAGGSSAGPELLESEEHAKKAALATEAIIRGAVNFWNIL